MAEYEELIWGNDQVLRRGRSTCPSCTAFNPNPNTGGDIFPEKKSRLTTVSSDFFSFSGDLEYLVKNDDEQYIADQPQTVPVCQGQKSRLKLSDELEIPQLPKFSNDRPHHRYKEPYNRQDLVEESVSDQQSEAPVRRKRDPERGDPTGSSLKRRRDDRTEATRRKKINKKMRALQALIPNSHKVDKVSVLDSAIEHVKTLQLQLQMMSMGSNLYMSPMFLQSLAGLSPMGFGLGMRMPMAMSMAQFPAAQAMPMLLRSQPPLFPFLGAGGSSMPLSSVERLFRFSDAVGGSNLQSSPQDSMQNRRH